MQHAGRTLGDGGGMTGRVDTIARRFDAVNLHRAVIDKGMEHADGV